MIDAVSEGALTIEKLEAMTCVCSVGLDMIAIPGDTKATTIAGIIADEAAIGMINQKTTAVRPIPVIGKQWAIRQSSAVCLAMRRSFRSTVSPATTLLNVPDVSRHQYTALRTNRSFIWINHRNWREVLLRYLDADLERIIFSNPRTRESYLKLTVRPLLLRGRLLFRREEFTEKQAFQKNQNAEKTAEYLLGELENRYRNAEIASLHGIVNILISKKGR